MADLRPLWGENMFDFGQIVDVSVWIAVSACIVFSLFAIGGGDADYDDENLARLDRDEIDAYDRMVNGDHSAQADTLAGKKRAA